MPDAEAALNKKAFDFLIEFEKSDGIGDDGAAFADALGDGFLG